MKKLLALISALMLLMSLFGCARFDENEAGFPPVENIDHAVLEPDERAALSDDQRAIYARLAEAMIQREETAALSQDEKANALMMDFLRESPYYFLVDSMKKEDGALRFSYVYDEAQHRRIVDFMDEEFLSITNTDAEDDDNRLDVIMKLYHAVTGYLTYDNRRKDNKELSSPLFFYPDDEIFKAMKTKKSLCYGFSYILSFALQQRGIDNFKIIGQRTVNPSGHMWVAFSYQGKYYHCDPTWDRTDNNYAKLFHFGKTDRERENDFCQMKTFSSYHLSTVDSITCDDKRFSIFRGAVRFSFIADHRFFIETNKQEKMIFDTERFALEQVEE